jgi:uncharacterized protein YndB with AHSA1/START domain
MQLTKPVTGTKGMLIRKPPADVFRAFADPAVTTKFWFTKSSGPVVEGAQLVWEWEMFGAKAPIAVKHVERDRRIVFEWAGGRTVEMKFVPHQGHTYVSVTETGYPGTGDDAVAAAIDSIGGFALVLAAAKALLEHDVVLRVVADHVVPGLAI